MWVLRKATSSWPCGDDRGPDDDVNTEVKFLRKAAASLRVFDLQFWVCGRSSGSFGTRARVHLSLVGQALRVLVGPRLGFG